MDTKEPCFNNVVNNNKGKSVEARPEQNWLNDLANAEKPPLTFDDLMSTPIDFTAFVMNRLKLTKLTKADLVGPISHHDVYSIMKILSIVSVTVDRQFGYGYLKEIMVRRAYQKLYKFMEGDFSNLHLNDIEDMLLLNVQNKLFNLEGDIIVDLEAALRMYTRRIIVQKRVKDVQLDAESYEKKLNITKP
ncbi:hypothetical protein Tco_1371549 [Tanacetum coccineum]